MVLDGGIDSDRPGALPVLSGGGALGNGRMHGVPQMLECYLQLSGRAGERQRSDVSVGVACHSSPHYRGRGRLLRRASFEPRMARQRVREDRSERRLLSRR